MDDPGELASDEEAHSESYSAVNTGGRDVLTSDREQVGEELQQVVSQLCLFYRIAGYFACAKFRGFAYQPSRRNFCAFYFRASRLVRPHPSPDASAHNYMRVASNLCTCTNAQASSTRPETA